MKMWSAGAAVDWDRNEVALSMVRMSEKRWTIATRDLVFAEVRVWSVWHYGWHMGSRTTWSLAMDFIAEYELANTPKEPS